MSVRLGPRDAWALLWLSQMGAAPMDVFAALLACWPLRKPRPGMAAETGGSEINAYRVTRRFRTAGKIVVDDFDNLPRPVPGPSWVVPTAPVASQLLEFTVKPWVPGPMMANHLATVARVRLALAEGRIEDSWVSERVLRHRNGFATRAGEQMPHVHDGHWIDDDGDLHAIEVELTRKGSADARTTMQAAYDAAKDAGAVSLRYYVDSPEVRSRLAAAARDLDKSPGGPQVVSRDLTTLLNPSAGHGRGLSVVGGTAS
ncbi:hypothetical protein [Nocardia wallacei]|uniref:hypothetical protein n=1 Tax=Nocardia wallacei TaxID=480035 RepID=UPI002455774E|nr:hypothetical protein [Nocardia wallacei]